MAQSTRAFIIAWVEHCSTVALRQNPLRTSIAGMDEGRHGSLQRIGQTCLDNSGVIRPVSRIGHPVVLIRIVQRPRARAHCYCGCAVFPASHRRKQPTPRKQKLDPFLSGALLGNTIVLSDMSGTRA